MVAGNTLIEVHLAPKDVYSFQILTDFSRYCISKWKKSAIYGAEETKILSNNILQMLDYRKSIKIYHWYSGKDFYNRPEKEYQDIVGTAFYDYESKYNTGVKGEWGIPTKSLISFSKHRSNKRYDFGTPMLNFDKLFKDDKIIYNQYMLNQSYFESFATANNRSSLVTDLTKYYRNEEHMSEHDALISAGKDIQKLAYNECSKKHNILVNDYMYYQECFNKFEHSLYRTMASFTINVFFLKELLQKHPNVSIYLKSPNNRMLRLVHMVMSYEHNTIIKIIDDTQNKRKFEYIYSVSNKTLIHHPKKGIISVDKMSTSDKILNLRYGTMCIKVSQRMNLEKMYDFIFEDGQPSPWIDKYHNVFYSENYKNVDNLINKKIY